MKRNRQLLIGLTALALVFFGVQRLTASPAPAPQPFLRYMPREIHDGTTAYARVEDTGLDQPGVYHFVGGLYGTWAEAQAAADLLNQ